MGSERVVPMTATEEAAAAVIAENADREPLKGVIPDVNSKAYKIP